MPIVSSPHADEFNNPLETGQPADLLTEQSRILDQDMHAFLTETAVLPTETAQPCAETAALPGFETITEADLRLCPDWCVHQGLPVHGDGFDPDPDQAPHRSVEHTIRAIHGGESIDHAGRAEVTVQLEQDHDFATGPTVNLSVAVRGIEQYAWLTLPETRALQHALTHLLAETEGAG